MKYLISCGPGIGDLILILPMVKRIKEVDRHSFIAVFVPSDFNRIKISRQMLEMQNEIDLLDYYSLKEKAHIPAFLFKLGKRRYDWGFVLQYTDNPDTSIWPYKIIKLLSRKTCGIKLNYHPKAKYDIEIERVDGFRIAGYPMKMLDAVGIENVKIDYTKLVNKEIFEKYFSELCLNVNEKLISLVVGTACVGRKINGYIIKNDAKNWPYKNWISLCNRLIERGYMVALLGGKKEYEEISDFEIPPKAINLLGKCNIMQSISVLERSKIVIGADTGLMHCAGALNVPSLTLFGCTDYREYLPFGEKSEYISSTRSCSPCFGTQQALICKNKECMSEITVDMVYSKIIEILSRS